MGKHSKRILVSALIAVLAAMLISLLLNFGWLPVSGGLSRQDAELRYPYQQLNRREQALYSALCEGIANYDEIIKLPGIYQKWEYERVYLMVAMQEPQFFYLDSVYETADAMADVNMFYSVEQDQIAVMRSQIDLIADRIIEKAASAASDLQKLLVIHDEIAALCEYSDGSFQSEAYGCLVNGKAKCEGYSKALLYVARRAGLNIMNVAGTIRGVENHVWNIAKLDGTYYNIDITWDDDKEYRGYTAHVCFAVPDKDFRDHRVDMSSYQPPVCGDDEHNYYQMNGLLITSAAELPYQVQQWPWNPMLIEFRLDSEDVYKDVSEILSSSEEVRDAVKLVSGAASYRAIVDETRLAMVIMPS